MLAGVLVIGGDDGEDNDASGDMAGDSVYRGREAREPEDGSLSFMRGKGRVSDTVSEGQAGEPSPGPTVVATPTGVPYVFVVPEGRAAVVDVICAYSWNCETALRVAWCESSWGRALYNSVPIYNAGVENHAVGWFGLALPLHQRHYDGPSGSIGADTAAAFSLYAEQGWNPWPFWAYTYC